MAPKYTGRDVPGSRGFPKGVSGNPGGRSKAAAVIAKLIAEKTENGKKLVEYAMAVVENEDADHKSWQYCHNWLTERVAGKAPQVVTFADDHEAPVDFAQLTNEQLAALATLDETNPDPEAKVLRLVPPDDAPPDDEPGGAA